MRNIEAKERGESWGYRDLWQVNCANMWIATLGKRLTPELAVHSHNLVVLHELAHALSGERDCWNPYPWDKFLEKLLQELKGKKLEIWDHNE